LRLSQDPRRQKKEDNMDINELISPIRLETYETVLKVKTDEKKLAAYYWNKAITASLFPAMQCLEISLRNAINEAVKNNPPFSIPCFTDLSTSKVMAVDDWIECLVSYISRKRIKKLGSRNKKKWLKPNGDRTNKTFWEEDQIERAKRKLQKYGRAPTSDRLISELMLGFWTNLLSQQFEDQTTGTLLWPNLTPYVFSNLPENKTIDDIRLILDRLQDFRNRFSHHEPVFKFYYEKSDGKPNYLTPVFGRSASLSILEKTYADILELIRWISEERHKSFIDAGLSRQFYRLISDDGFYSYVDPEKISKVIKYSSSRREHRKLLAMIDSGDAFRIDKKSKIHFVFGPM
jgi:hypothetical protein